MSKIAIYSGSWNPLHAGHLSIAHWAEDRGYEVKFELCRSRYDKTSLTDSETEKIQKQFSMLNRELIITPYISFVEKAINLAPRFTFWGKITFLIGYDTAERVCNPKYYCDSSLEMYRCLKILSKHANFIVFERYGKKSLDDFPEIFQNMATVAWKYIPINISSTQIRQQE